MTCKHQIALCSLHGCAKCEHHGHEDECTLAAHDDADDLCPTFNEMIEIYNSGKRAGNIRKRGVAGMVRRSLKELGIPIDAKASLMTRTKFKTLIQVLTSPTRTSTKQRPTGGALCDDTVSSHLSAFRAISSDSLEDLYEAKGLDLPSFSIPRFEIRRRPVQEVSDRTIRNVEVQMEKWLASGTRSDKSAYILTFFALYCGARLDDICNFKWSVFKQTPVGLMVVYTPRKSVTYRNPNGKRVSFCIDSRTFCKIETLVGNADEYVIPRLENRIGRKAKKNGLYCGQHRYLAKKVRKALKECGIGNDYCGQKSIHALRKYFETDRAFKLGSKEAADACGHTVRVQERHYLGTLVGKVS